MKFSLILCTYMRAESLKKLLDSVKLQTLYPDEILIIDGSTNNLTKVMLEQNSYSNLQYFKVDDENRGLTKQRNFGIEKVNPKTQIICFLDDDTILETNYFEELIDTYNKQEDALGVGGFITNEVKWFKKDINKSLQNKFEYDGWFRNEPLRFRIRKLFNLQPDVAPCFLPTFSHGRSVSFLPPTGKTYPVELFMGCAMSFNLEKYKLNFSTYFEGYGLYEDADYCLRLAKHGNLYVNTNAKLEHHHHAAGRPNKFKYGKMVTRNGWYIWRVKYASPSVKSRLKWNATAILLAATTFLGVITSSKKREAFTEALGRFYGLVSLIFNKPKLID